ncbi:MAG: phasin family protein [Pseudomonadota bacterium]
MAEDNALMTAAETMLAETSRAGSEAREAVERVAQEQAERVATGVTEVTKMSQQAFDALVASSRVTAKAVEAVNAELVAFSKRHYEEGVAAAKDALHARSLSELLEKQSRHQKAVLEDGVDEIVRLNDLLSGAMVDAFAPLSDRMQAAARIGRS